MTEELNRKESLKKQFPLLLMLAIIGFVSLLIGVGASFLKNKEDTSSLPQGVYQEFLAADWNDPQGQSIDTSTWKNKTIVINFWASWCPPCVEEMPLLDAFYRENSSKGWQVIGLAIDQPSQVRRFLEQFPVTYPVGLAGLGGSELGRALGNTEGALPFTVVVDAQGRIKQRKVGRLSEEEVKNWT
jgi:thiol-disulfide isomerase/thioredoxin